MLPALSTIATPALLFAPVSPALCLAIYTVYPAKMMIIAIVQKARLVPLLQGMMQFNLSHRW
jgi:hypothetical protein